MSDDPDIPARLRRTSADEYADHLHATVPAGSDRKATEVWYAYIAWAGSRSTPPTSKWLLEKAMLAAGFRLRVVAGRRVWTKSPELRLVSLAEDLRRI